MSRLEIRNFCTGIAVVRSHNVRLHNLKISESHGTAGVIFTGDDGNFYYQPYISEYGQDSFAYTLTRGGVTTLATLASVNVYSSVIRLTGPGR